MSLLSALLSRLAGAASAVVQPVATAILSVNAPGTWLLAAIGFAVGFGVGWVV